MDLKKLMILAVIIAGVFVALRLFKQTDVAAFDSSSKIRVQAIFDNLTGGPDADPQKAIGFWRIGGNEAATDASLTSFEKWLARKNLTMKVGSYEFLSSRVENGEDVVNRYAIVTFRVDGRTLSVEVRQGSPVEWAG
jgi:hypothetical protein